MNDSASQQHEHLGTMCTTFCCFLNKRVYLLLAIRACLNITAAYLQQHLPMSNSVLHDLQCLHPLARKHAPGRATVGRLCQHLKKVSKTDVFVDRVDAEWLLYMALKEVDLLLHLVCVSFTIIGQPRNSVLIRRV